jgi:hypothetical protein
MDSVSLDKVLVRNILQHPNEHRWTMQDIGLLGLRLDDRREFRLHVWCPDRSIAPPVIHDHPYDFVSRIVVGELTNMRYVEDPRGSKYVRDRYSPPDEELRTTDMVQLSSTSETYRERDEYAQSAPELHDSRQLPGTVTILRMTFRDVRELTTCRSEDDQWVSGLSRRATADEVRDIAAVALDWF